MAAAFSVIIPSKTAANLVPCLRAVGEHDPKARVIVVDDGLADPRGILEAAGNQWVEMHFGVKPFVFARNVNIGIRAAGVGDVVLLNDDALLQTPGGFTLLARAAEEHPEYGVIGAACNSSGNRNQWPQGKGLREDPRIVCFMAVYIPRRTIETVGLLDERFGGVDSRGRRVYGFEDDDYCYRVRRAGLKIGIHDGCIVDHKTLKSTFRATGHCPLEPGRDLFIQKWGSYPL